MAKMTRTLKTYRAAERDSKNRLAFSVFKNDQMKSFGISLGVFTTEEAGPPAFSTMLSDFNIEQMRVAFDKLITGSPNKSFTAQLEEKNEEGKFVPKGSMALGIDEQSNLFIHIQGGGVNSRFMLRGDLRLNFAGSEFSKQMENKAIALTLISALTTKATIIGEAMTASAGGAPAASGGDGNRYSGNKPNGGWQPRNGGNGGGGNWQNRNGGGGGGNWQNKGNGGGNWQNRNGGNGGGGNWKNNNGGGNNWQNRNNNSGGSNTQPSTATDSPSSATTADDGMSW